CADQNLRSMMTNCAVSAINQAYELFQYMNQKGMYQIPTLNEQTTQTMMNTYQTGSRPMFQ
ncbi:MAG TPA: spore coat protein, partial [Desulfobacteria bacterium]|nr:spore coat protein [Desulfobacteria bacterium]